MLAVEATAAAAYWSVWAPIPLHFARRAETPEHWRTFGGRRSPLSGKPLKAAYPGHAILNYIYAVAASEMTIALTGAGLDSGIGIFHTDRDRRASLAYDAIEAVRPYVDSWLGSWLATARFSKRDFYEESDGTIRLTRPLTSHLAMTAAVWRPAAQAVADWLARAFAEGVDAKRGLPPPLPALPTHKRSWQSFEPPIPKMCHECSKALTPRQRKFCSEACAIRFHVATTTPAELPAAGAVHAAVDPPQRRGRHKNSRHLALRRAWDAEHASAKVQPPTRKRNSWTKASGPDVEHLRQWFTTTVVPRLAECSPAEIRGATGLTTRYAIMIHQGHVPHPRHYASLAGLVGAEAPS